MNNLNQPSTSTCLNEDESIKVDLIRNLRGKLLAEKAEITAELKKLDEEEVEIGDLLPTSDQSDD